MAVPTDPTAPQVLVVDDSPVSIELLERLLRAQGYIVRSFSSGAKALESARAEPPELILLDVDMPDLNGYQVCAQLKTEPRLADVPVLFISGMTALSDKVKAFEVGGVDYVTKPFVLGEVLARAATHLKLHRLQRELAAKNAELAAALESAQHLSRTDPLTGLLNRRAFAEMVALELENARRYDHPVSLAVVDLDRFKLVNDTYGHEAGDLVLVAVAEALRQGVRAVDQVARLGGDEFAVLLPRADGAMADAAAMRMHGRLLDCTSAAYAQLGASLGVATCAGGICPLDTLLRAADEAMYEAKQAGRNGWRRVDIDCTACPVRGECRHAGS